MGRRKQNFPSRSNANTVSKLFTASPNASFAGERSKSESAKTFSTTFLSTDIEIYDSASFDPESIIFAEVILENVTHSVELNESEITSHNLNHNLRVRLVVKRVETSHFGDSCQVSEDDMRVEFLLPVGDLLGSLNCNDGEKASSYRILASGYLSGPEPTISSLVYLFKQGYVSLIPRLERIIGNSACVDSDPSCILGIGVTPKAFESGSSLYDSTSNHSWTRNFREIMKWARPELHMDEAIYGFCSLERGEEEAIPKSGLGIQWKQSDANKSPFFDPATIHEAIKPNQTEPLLEDHIHDLVPELRAYQRRAAYWMVMREKGLSRTSAMLQNSTSPKWNDTKRIKSGGIGTGMLKCPLSLHIISTDGEQEFFYNPFSGSVSRDHFDLQLDIRGGILADEMGLGKTVELIACILANNNSESIAVDGTGISMSAESAACTLNMRLLERKRERVECPCGTYADNRCYSGSWVQCDSCDCWQHAPCVGFGSSTSNEVGGEFIGLGKRKREVVSEIKCTKKQVPRGVKKEGFVCGKCAELIGSVEVKGVSRSTLIVCPTSILQQWQEEIARHTRVGALSVLVYNGVQSGCLVLEDGSYKHVKIVGAHTLANVDIVLTTYETLRGDLAHDLDPTENGHRSMRFEKRYPVIPTPLTRLHWWRVCLDEAQMVEGNTGQATEMALRLNAEIRWCVTGTPIQKSLDDVYGLIRFLGIKPFDKSCWWKAALKQPYEEGNTAAVLYTHELLRKFMWRSSKSQVRNELKLPPQEERVTWLNFSPVEAHFYRKQHEGCARTAQEIVMQCKKNSSLVVEKDSDSMHENCKEYDRLLTADEAAKIFNPLLRLRQACCHPQVGSAGLRSLQRTPMNMNEILEVLVAKAKTEGEEWKRMILGALNGLAALAILERELPTAITIYREALATADDSTDDFRVDPLQKLHILYNLNETLRIHGSLDGMESNCHEVPRTLRDSLLEKQCQEMKDNYMASFYSRLSSARHEFQTAFGHVETYLEELKASGGNSWWLDVLVSVEHSGKKGSDFVEKIREHLLDKSKIGTSKTMESGSCLAHRFRDASGLRYLLQKELDALDTHRKKLLDKSRQIDLMVDNPTKEDIEETINCPKCSDQQKGLLCAFCKIEKLFQLYLNRLFLLKSSEFISSEDVLAAIERARETRKVLMMQSAGIKKAGLSSANMINEELGRSKRFKGASEGATLERNRAPSETETTLKLLKSYSKQNMDQNTVTAARKHLQVLEAMRKEFACSRTLADAQRGVLNGLDELNMATARLRLRLPGESPTDLTEDLFKLYPEEIPVKNAELTSEKLLALHSFSESKGQLRYLKGLMLARVKSTKIHESSNGGDFGQLDPNNVSDHQSSDLNLFSEKGSEEEKCVICFDILGRQRMILPCGHLLCCKCTMDMIDRMDKPIGIREQQRIFCPFCRRRTFVGDIAFVSNGGADSSFSKMFGKLQETEKDLESDIIVKGSYGTKMEAVARRILSIKSKDPQAKFLVFSTWNDVLDVVEHTLSANGIGFLRAKGNRGLNAVVSRFKGIEQKEQKVIRKQRKEASDNTVEVLLLLIKQGANGLNLVEAKHVIMIEPLLNPGDEVQAINRVHRIGQRHATFVHRFLIKETVEESIHRLWQCKGEKPLNGVQPWKNKDHLSLTLRDVGLLFTTCKEDRGDEKPVVAAKSLRDLPPAMAAVAAAEARLHQASHSRVSK